MKHLLNTIYLLTPDSYLFLENEAVSVRVGGEEKTRIPAHTISDIICFGKMTVSTPLVAYCGEKGIGLSFFSENGKFYGRVQGPVRGNVLLRQRQFAAAADPAQCRNHCKSFLLGKLINSKEFLSRQKREKPDRNTEIIHAIEQITSCAAQLKDCSSIDSMRGLEGVAASAYFSAMPSMLSEGTFAFDGRNRRPPEDPVNAVLSFLYTLLKNDVQSALEGVGLDPAVGFLHSLRPGRPALALDMMEELRAPLCDRLTLSLINRRQISKDSFEQLSAPVLLNDTGRKTIIRAWQERKQETITHPFLKEKMPIGLIPHVQAQLFARVLRDELDEYPPFHWR